MKKEYNTQYFYKEDVSSGAMLSFVSSLLELNNKTTDLYNEVLIRPEDLGAVVVEWTQISRESPENFGSFKYVDVDQSILTEFVLPDNTIQMVESQEEADDLLTEWLTNHPTWEQNQYGRWYDKEEAEAFRKSLEG